MLWRTLGGIAASTQMTGASLYLADISNRLNRARTFAPLMIAWSCGAAIGPAAGGFLADAFGFRAPFVMVSVMIFAISILNRLTLPETLTNKLAAESQNIA